MVRIFNIYRQELRFYRKSTLIWMAVFALGVFFYLTMFDSFTKDIATSMKLIQGFPPAVKAALGIRVDIFFTIFGFFGYLLNYFWLLGAVQATNLGIGVLSKEVSGKTADFLLSKPVSRFKVLTSKLAAVLTVIILTNVVFITASYLSALMFSKESFDVQKFVIICSTMFFVQMFFLALGFLVATIVPKIKTVVAWSLPITFGFFIAGLLESIIGSNTMRYITPFKYYDISYILEHGALETKFVIINLSMALIFVVTAYIIYYKKDVKAPA